MTRAIRATIAIYVPMDIMPKSWFVFPTHLAMTNNVFMVFAGWSPIVLFATVAWAMPVTAATSVRLVIILMDWNACEIRPVIRTRAFMEAAPI